MKRSSAVVLALTCLVTSACDMITAPTDETPNADGTYKGDFQIVYNAVTRTSSGGFVFTEKSVTGAVGFTIQGTKVITTPSAGEGQVIWDHVNNTMWVEFQSINSSNETYCSRWRYYGGLLKSDQFLKGEGSINCVAPGEDHTPWKSSYWKVTRQ